MMGHKMFYGEMCQLSLYYLCNPFLSGALGNIYEFPYLGCTSIRAGHSVGKYLHPSSLGLLLKEFFHFESKFFLFREVPN